MTAIAEPTTELRHHLATLDVSLVEKRSADGTMRVRGTAIVYDQPSPRGNLPWREVIRPGAFRSILADPSTDLLLLWSHDSAAPLARQSAGNLQVRDTARGVEFSATLPNTSVARDAYELLRSRIVKGCSFGFVPDPEQETISQRDGETWIEVHGVAQLRELSLTGDPVYSQTDAEARSSVLAAVRRQRIEISERTSYGPSSRFSYFRDLARDAIDTAQRQALRGTSNALEGWVPPEPEGVRPRDPDDTLEAVRQRLKVAEETWARAVSTGVGSAEPFAPSSTGSGFISGLFATAVRAQAAVASALRQEPLEPGAMAVHAPRLTTGSTATTGADNASVASQDVVSAAAQSPVRTISGQVDAAMQVMDQSPDFDTAMSQDLGAALGATLELQCINGSGGAIDLAGLLGRSGIVSVSYTSGSPTAAAAFSKVQDASRQVHEGLGQPGGLFIAMRPGRKAWFDATPPASAYAWRGRVVESAAIPTTLGAGTEDRVLAIASDFVALVSRPPQVRVLVEILSGTLGVRFQAWQYVALVVRHPTGVGVVSGTGLAASGLLF